MSGLGKQSRTTNINTDYMFNSCYNPILLTDLDTGEVLFTNPTPGVSTYTRPLATLTAKDNTEAMIAFIKEHERQIRTLVPKVVVVGQVQVTVTFEVIPCMMDGKMRTAIYTVMLRDAVQMGWRFKVHGNQRLIDPKTCWVRLPN